MKELGQGFKKIYRTNGWLFALMALILLASLALLITSLVTLNPNAATVKVAYSDVGGYVDGGWSSMFAFSLFAILFGFLHNFLMIKIFEKHGSGLAYVFAIITLMLVLGAFVVLVRLLGEA